MTHPLLRAVGVCMALVLAACEQPDPGLDERCLVCAAGSGSYVQTGCGATIELECTDGLYCNDTTGTCNAYRGVGEDCNDGTDYLCESSLVCAGFVCEAPLADGAPCTATSHCEPTSFCNGGGLPDEPRGGICTPVAGEVGAPCAWTASEDAAGWQSKGCADALACVPDVALDPAAAAAAHAAPNPCPLDVGDATLGDESCLGWPGHCAAPGELERSEPCVDDRSCSSGLCVWLPPPRVESGANPAPFHAPWPGVCAGPNDAVPDGECQERIGCGVPCEAHADCFDGTLCSQETCLPAYLNDVGGPCGDPATPPQDGFCGVGFDCHLDDWGYGTCRFVGDGTDGAPCAEHEDCAADLRCALSVCVRYRALDEPCDYDLRCGPGLDCALATQTCAPPGPQGQGTNCAEDANCGTNMYCNAETGHCEGRGGLGAYCSTSYRCDLGLVCVDNVDTGLGACERP